MEKPENSIFKKGYTEFDQRLDQELEEEKEERRRQLLLQAPDFKLLNQMLESGEYSQDLASKLKDGGLYYLRSGEEESAERFMSIFRKTLELHPTVREDLIKQAGFLGCMAFKRDMPRLGRYCGEAILSGLRLLGPEDRELTEEGYLQFKNVTDTAVRTRNEWDFREIVTALQKYWETSKAAITTGFVSILSDLLFVAADRRQINALKTICRLSRSVMRHDSVDRVMRQQFAMEWSNTAAQIAQRGWAAECQMLLKHLCLCLGSLRDDVLIKKVMADVSLHMQIQSKWDNFETAFRLFYPCQLFSLVLLRWGMNRYNRVLLSEKVLEVEAATRDSGMLGQVERKMELLEEKEKALGMIRFVLRNGRDMAAACARLLMKDEWEIYATWQREWLSAFSGKEKRRKQVQQFMQMMAEYWHSTQPSRSNKQWEFMTDIMNPSCLSDKHLNLIKLVS